MIFTAGSPTPSARMIETGAQGLSQDIALADLEAWLACRNTVLETRAQVRVHEAAIETALCDARKIRDRLEQALAGIGCAPAPDTGVERLVAGAEHAAELHQERTVRMQAGHGALAEADGRIEQREAEHRRAVAEERDWTLRWRQALSGCWMSAIVPAADVPHIMAAVDTASELANRASGTPRPHAENRSDGTGSG